MTVIYANFHRPKPDAQSELLAACALAEVAAERLAEAVTSNCDRQLEAASKMLTQVQALLAGLDGNGGCR